MSLELALQAWIEEVVGGSIELKPLTGDVSARRYYRIAVAETETAIAAAYPQSLQESCGRFVRSTELLSTAGVVVPRIQAYDCEQGFMLMEDVGTSTLYDQGPDWQATAAFLPAALRARDRIATVETQAVAELNPPLDAALLRRELTQTQELVLPQVWGTTSAIAAAADDAFDQLCERLGSEEPIPCHRDYMARNLVPQTGGQVTVLDHQDLRLGPRQYDLASLLNDSLYVTPLEESTILEPMGWNETQTVSYHRAAAQRGLKIAGTFEAFRRRGQDRYVPLIERSLKASYRHLDALPEGAELSHHLRRRGVC